MGHFAPVAHFASRPNCAPATAGMRLDVGRQARRQYGPGP